MSLRERIDEIKDYFCGIDYFNDALMVKVKYPKQVNAIGNDELGIKVTKGEDDIVYYYGNKNEIEIEDVFDLIKTTVKIYEEAKLKAALYRAKCEELKDIFGTKTLSELDGLYFGFSEPVNTVVKTKRKYTRKKKENNENIETVEEEVVETKTTNAKGCVYFKN